MMIPVLLFAMITDLHYNYMMIISKPQVYININVRQVVI